METNVAKNLRKVLASLPENVQLIAISKFHPCSKIIDAYNEGQRIFGESQEKEISQKVKELPKDIQWHFIGHLQTNKVRFIAPYINMVESVDSIKLMKEINKQAIKNGRIIDILLELHIAEEATKNGLTLDNCRQLLEAGEWKSMNGIRICGLMMMASNIGIDSQLAKEFDTAKYFFDEIKERFFSHDEYFKYRSWGMSHDYSIAIDHGSNMVRVGTAIFGEREY